MVRSIIVIGLVTLISACADSHQLMRTGNSTSKLDQAKSVYISVPRDGSYGNTNYQGSGVNTSQIILMEFSKYTNAVETAHQYQTFQEALEYSKQKHYHYLVFPTILEWEDRATEWSSIPDKASIKIAIIDVASGKSLNSVIIKGKSGIATFGGDHPQDLLPKPVSEYISSLY